MIRRRGREMAVQILYALELHPSLGERASVDGDPRSNDGDPLNEGVNAHALQLSYEDYISLMDEPIEMDDPSFQFARRLVEGVLIYKRELDACIQKYSKNWRLNRMSWVDRNILRLGVFELSYCPDIPGKVAINEAIELAKKFSNDDAVSFINGILDAVLRDKCQQIEMSNIG